jgi:hypothetical protein
VPDESLGSVSVDALDRLPDDVEVGSSPESP